jgi:hypothetical protein
MIDVLHQFFFADGISKAHGGVMKANLLTGFYLVVDIGLACTIIADKNDSEVRCFLSLGFTVIDLGADFRFYFCGNSAAVNEGIGLCFCHL